MALLAVALLLALPTGGDTAAAQGLRMWIPPGWHEVERKLTPCSNPVERLTIAGPGGGLVQVQERLGRNVARGFPRRPPVFVARGRPEEIACCAPTRGRGWFIPFRDGDRAFYGYVYGRSARSRQLAFQALSSVLVDPRGGRPNG